MVCPPLAPHPCDWGSWYPPPPETDIAPGSGAVVWEQGWIPRVGSLGCPMQGQRGYGGSSGLGVPCEVGAGRSDPPGVALQWPEVLDSSGEGVWAPHEELLHPSYPARRVSGVCGVGVRVQPPPAPP